jgi:chromosome segregation ATPase
MATLRLTPQIAFQAARQLTEEGRLVNSSSIHDRSQVGGSLGTAQKWAALWHAFEKGEEVEAKFQKFRSVYEAVKRGEEVAEEFGSSEDDLPIPQIEGAIGDLAVTVSALVRQLVEEETAEARESCAEVARHERSLTDCARGELQRATEELNGLRQAHEELLERFEVLARAKEVLQGKHESLEQQCADKEEHIARLEGQVAEVAQKYGASQARVDELEVTLKTEQARSKGLESQCATLRNAEGHLVQKCTALDVELKGTVSRFDDERSQREKLEADMRTLNTQLLERESRAATAQEKVRQLEERTRQLEAHNAELKEEVREMRERMMAEESKTTRRRGSGGSQ